MILLSDSNIIDYDITILTKRRCNTMMLDMKKVLKHSANRALEFQYDVTKNYVESR